MPFLYLLVFKCLELKSGIFRVTYSAALQDILIKILFVIYLKFQT